MEPCGAKVASRDRAAEPLHEVDEHARREAQLLARLLSLAQHEPWLLRAAIARGFNDERREAHQRSGLAEAWRRDDGAVAHEAVERKKARAEPGNPEPDRERADAVLPGDGADALAAQHGAHRREDHVDTCHFAGENIRGQHPLAVMTRTAARNRNHERDAAADEDVQLPGDAGPGQPGSRAVATPAAVPPQQPQPVVVRRRVDDRVIAAMIHIEYVSHVLKAASGEVGQDKTEAAISITAAPSRRTSAGSRPARRTHGGHSLAAERARRQRSG